MSNIFSTPDQLTAAAAAVLNGEQIEIQEAKFVLPPKMQKVLDEISAVTAELVALDKQIAKIKNAQEKLLLKQDKLKDKYFTIDHTFDSEADEDKATELFAKAMNGK